MDKPPLEAGNIIASGLINKITRFVYGRKLPRKYGIVTDESRSGSEVWATWWFVLQTIHGSLHTGVFYPCAGRAVGCLGAGIRYKVSLTGLDKKDIKSRMR